MGKGNEDRGASSAQWLSLRRAASELAPGTTASGLRCPFCAGGRSGEHSLSLTLCSTGIEALYCCHRASCGKAGRLDCLGRGLYPSSTSPGKSGSHQAQKLYTGRVRPVGTAWLSYLVSTMGFLEEVADREGWSEDVETGYLVLPIRNRRSVRIGTEIRKPPFRPLAVGPKARLYFEEYDRGAGWFPNIHGASSPTVVVEDSFSAVKVRQAFCAVALYGTHLNLERIQDLLQAGPDIILALDKDATEKAVEYQKQFGLYGNIRVAPLERDLKYETTDRIKQIVEKAR